MTFALPPFLHRLFTPATRLIVTLGDDGAFVLPTGLETAPFFTAFDKKRALPELAACLERFPQPDLLFLLDNLAQDYRLDTLPPLNILDKRRLAARRLKQNFPAAPRAAFRFLRHARDKILMVGLHDSNAVFPWLNKTRARLPEVALLPVEGAATVSQLLPDRTGWAMTVSRHRSGGYRQIVLRDGDLVFTRLTPLPPYEDADEGEIVARDIKASLDYLKRQGLDKAEDLFVLRLSEETENERAALSELRLRGFSFLPPREAAAQLGLDFPKAAEAFPADYLYAAATARRKRPLLSLRPADIAAAAHERFIQRAGLRAASILLAISLMFAAWNVAEFFSATAEARRESALLAQARQDLAEAQQSAAPVTEPLGHLRVALERRRIFDRPTATPWGLLTALRQALSEEAHAQKFDWKLTEAPKSNGKAAAKSDEINESLSLSLHLAAPLSEDDRAATVAAFAALARHIAETLPAYDVAVTRAPYPGLAQDTVTADTDAHDDPNGELTLRRRQP